MRRFNIIALKCHRHFAIIPFHCHQLWRRRRRRLLFLLSNFLFSFFLAEKNNWNEANLADNTMRGAGTSTVYVK